MTQKQEDNWIDWKDVLKRFEDAKKSADVMYGELSKGKPLNNLRMDVIQQALILAFFTMLPPRRAMDFQLLRITPGKLEDDLEKDCNWLSLEESKIQFNQFKTAKIHGSQEIDIPAPLLECVKRYYDILPNKEGFVFQRPDGMLPRGNNTITRLLNRVFHPLKVSVNILRHSFLTHKYAPDEEEIKKQKEREEIAKKMGHSRSQQEDYILDDSAVDDEMEEKMKSVKPRKPRTTKAVSKAKGGSRVAPVVGELEALGLADDDDDVRSNTRIEADDPGENLRNLFIEL